MGLRERMEDRTKQRLRAYDGHWDEVPMGDCEDVNIGHDHFHVCTRRTVDGSWHHRYFVNSTPRIARDFDKLATESLMATAEGERQ